MSKPKTTKSQKPAQAQPCIFELQQPTPTPADELLKEYLGQLDSCIVLGYNSQGELVVDFTQGVDMGTLSQFLQYHVQEWIRQCYEGE